ncbi:hypothetical protein FIBSPDRAFT_1048353 [Athelia psychrophila]|uniref:P-loop containing nucleoside triphosphate hydrolase protein n=1 Tax=Athelia psychrophila TaxID=1759441 RepID=A0A166DVR2_9AGAM|nr:hypothetical protein FIBSPDRAFT_1048353 [Fibularhizoctonia sp. CBS 109695]
MPVVRKKTSNRGTTKKRASIQDKGRESRKKQKRAAKTNVQWKSNIKKDPGIPSNYPYKDQILAEVAEERRQVAEEKQKRKDEKKASKTGGATDNASDVREAAEEPIVFDGVGGISGKATAREKGKGKVVDADVEMEDAEAVPVLINRDLASLQSVLDAADVIIQVLDARDPLAFRSIHLDEISAKTGKKTLLILNKIDTVPRESVASWLAYLRTQHPTLPFRASTACLPLSPEALANASKPRAKPSATDAPTADSILAQLSAWAQEKTGDEPLAVAVVGLTNAGKSAFINSLLGEVALPVYQLSSSSLAPTTTSLPQEVTLEASGSKIRVIDTPGLSWVAAEDQTLEERDIFRARDILLRNKGRIDRLKDPHSALEHIVSRADTEGLMLLYNLAAFPKGDASAFLAGVARSNGMVKKAGVLDLAGAARNVLRDWSVGRFPRFTPAPTAPTSAEQDVRDEAVLAQLKARKEMRKEGGLVKFVASPVESRRANVEGEWPGLKEEENSEDENEEGGSEEEEDVEMDDAEAEDSDEEEEEDVDEPMEEPVEEPVPIVSGKQKRAGKKLAPTRPAKKVAFAADPKESKQARSAAGAAGKKAVPPAKTPAKAAAPPAKTPAAPTATAKPANVPSGKKTTATRGGEEAYDFGKFF